MRFPSIYLGRSHNPNYRLNISQVPSLSGSNACFDFQCDMHTSSASSSGRSTDADSCSTVPPTPEHLDGEYGGGDTSGSSKTERPVRRVACDSCRRRKVRCDGNQPTCGRCNKLNQICVYTVPKNRQNSELMAQALIMLQSRLGK